MRSPKTRIGSLAFTSGGGVCSGAEQLFAGTRIAEICFMAHWVLSSNFASFGSTGASAGSSARPALSTARTKATQAQAALTERLKVFEAAPVLIPSLIGKLA